MDRASTASTFARHWRWETDRDGLAWLTFDKDGESANTFSRETLEELGRALAAIRVESPKGLIVRSGKDNFIAGADVEEFTRFKSPQEALGFVKLGWDAFQELRELPFPTTAMVNGFCMGGGVELALACRYRVALDDPKTRFALPEVMLGIMPAWHGLQWLPRLVGPAAALDMILTGRAVDARREAHRARRPGGAAAHPREHRPDGHPGGSNAKEAEFHESLDARPPVARDRNLAGEKAGCEAGPPGALPGAVRGARVVAQV